MLPRVLIATLIVPVMLTSAGAPRASETRTGFVTLLGRDTVALESYERTATRLEGDLMVRVPGTVLFHYIVERGGDGALTRTTIEMRAPGLRTLADRRVTLLFHDDSLRAQIDSAGHRRSESRAVPRDAAALFMTGFDESYGLYSSLGMYELAMMRLRAGGPDTLDLTAVDPLTARVRKQRIVRRAPTAVDVSYFGIAWTHVQLDGEGRILAADASETTEKTQSRRGDGLDVPRLARGFAKRDRDDKGLGRASPDTNVTTTIGGSMLVVSYGSPRLRGRTILGAVVPYDQVWRTGANAATTLVVDRPIRIGNAAVGAGAYSLWTMPRRDGVDLVINRQHGQWGTDYRADQDLARVPMKVSAVSAPRDAFAIRFDGTEKARTMHIAWGTFDWSVPVTVP